MVTLLLPVTRRHAHLSARRRWLTEMAAYCFSPQGPPPPVWGVAGLPCASAWCLL